MTSRVLFCAFGESLHLFEGAQPHSHHGATRFQCIMLCACNVLGSFFILRSFTMSLSISDIRDDNMSVLAQSDLGCISGLEQKGIQHVYGPMKHEELHLHPQQPCMSIDEAACMSRCSVFFLMM